MKTRMILHVFMMAAGLAVLGGCAGNIPPPNAQMAVAGSAVSKAENAGAVQYAPVELNSAREKLNRAQKAFDEEEYARARRFSEEAEVDANLAFAKARSANAQEAVAELQKTIRTLQEEMERIQAQ